MEVLLESGRIVCLRAMEQRVSARWLSPRWSGYASAATALVLAAVGGPHFVHAAQEAGAPPGRMLHFPKGLSLGRLMIQDAGHVPLTTELNPWADLQGWYVESEYLGEARGDVAVPPGKRVGLLLGPHGAADLSPLRKLGQDDLSMLSLERRSVRNDALRHIRHLSGLRDLYLGSASITSDGLVHLSGLTSLEALSLGGARLDADGLRHLAALERLQYLEPHGAFGDDGMVHLGKCPSLRYLRLAHLDITDAGLRHLAGHASLENLNLYNTRVTDRGLAYLASMPSLKTLDVGKRDVRDVDITDAGMVHLSKITTLERLSLPHRGISERGLAQVAKLGRLRHLWVGASTRSPLNDEALRAIAGLGRLESLVIGGTGFTDAGMDHLAGLTHLTSLNFIADQVTNEGLAKLKALEKLERLELCCPSASLAGLSQLGALTRLRELDVSQVMHGDSTLDLSGLRQLERCTIRLKVSRRDGVRYYDALEDEDLACLRDLARLKVLQLVWPEHSRVSDAGVAQLGGLTNLQELLVGGPRVTDRSLGRLAQLPALRRLSVTGHFTDDGLRHLERLNLLDRLNITSSGQFSAAALRRLEDTLLNLDASRLVVTQNCVFRNASRSPSSGTSKVMAPAFRVTTLDGRELRLADYRGKVVVLYFWATWCAPCVSGTPNLKARYADLKASFGDAVELISLSMDDRDEPVRRHVEQHGLGWPQARIGRRSRIASDYGVGDAAPRHYLVGPDGTLLLTPESPQVDTKALISELLSGRTAGEGAAPDASP